MLPLILLFALGACSEPTAFEAEAVHEVAEPQAVNLLDSNHAALDPETRPELLTWLRAHYADASPTLYSYGEYDLDGDGSKEIFVYIAGPRMCGSGGCNMIILTQDGDSLLKIADTTVTQLPIGVLETSNNGMRDIWVTVYGGGLREQIRKLQWNGSEYPSNPTVAPARTITTQGSVVIGASSLHRLD